MAPRLTALQRQLQDERFDASDFVRGMLKYETEKVCPP